MSTETFIVCERLLSAAANSIYQGALVAALAELTLRGFGRTNAATRHAVWFGALLFVTALIPIHFLLASGPRTGAGRLAANTASRHLTPPDVANMAATPILVTDSEPPINEFNVASDEQPGAASPNESADIGSDTTIHSDAVTEGNNGARFLPTTILKSLPWNLEAAVQLPHTIGLLLVSAWGIIAGARGMRIIARMVGIRQLKRTATLPNPAVAALFERLRGGLTARRNIRLRISNAQRTAALLGFAHPVVLLPAGMDTVEKDSEVEHVLRHELAHVARRDDWANLVQQSIQAALFFHPAVWWISARISLEREIACDDQVLAAVDRPGTYALTLANVASRMNQCRHSLAPGVSHNNSQLQQRITMILNKHRDRSSRLATSRLGIFTTATATLAVLAIVAGPRFVLGQSAPETQSATITADVAPVPAPQIVLDVPEIEAGPRAKLVLRGPHAVVVSDSPATPAVAPVPPVPPVAGVAPAAPTPTPSPMHVRVESRHVREDRSVEERLDRIERILERLEPLAEAKVRRRNVDGPSADGPKPPGVPGGLPMNINVDVDMAMKHAMEDAKRAAMDARRSVEIGQRAAEAGQRAVEQAVREVEAGQRAAEQAVRDVEAGQRAAEEGWREGAKYKNKDMDRQSDKLRELEAGLPLKELQALRSARDSLQREVEALQRQIKHLEEDQNHLKKPPGHSADHIDGKPEPGYHIDGKPESGDAPK